MKKHKTCVYKYKSILYNPYIKIIRIIVCQINYIAKICLLVVKRLILLECKMMLQLTNSILEVLTANNINGFYMVDIYNDIYYSKVQNDY